MIHYTRSVSILCFTFVFLIGCSKIEPKRDRPRVTSGVAMRDEVFHSAALNRVMQYRVLLPAFVADGQHLPVAYLLHGAGEDFRDWSNYSDVAQHAKDGWVLVMPQGDYSYYVNAAERPENRYEDYIVNDLISDIEAKFPVSKSRADRAIVGVSMGGFGAIKLALSHPDLFVFAGALSPAIDVPRRSFSLRRLQQSWEFKSIFGPADGAWRRHNDPFLVAQNVDPIHASYIFLSCGDGESLLAPNREFAALLSKQGLLFEFHVVSGGHDWTQWNKQLPKLFASMHQHAGRI